MGLIDEVNNVRKEIRTDQYSMSIGEWVSLYESGEIDIHPEFQRFFRWSDSQKSNFIESILLGIPIPSIFVSQREDGVWDVIDGLQRLSTVYQFLGILKKEDGTLHNSIVLNKTKYLPSLEGKKWEDSDPNNSLDQSLRLLIKRAKISVSIVLKESDFKAKYELFQRLNTGGSTLTEQEVRNCIMVMLNKNLFAWLKKLTEYEPFQQCISLSEKNIQEQYDVELALRFLLLFNAGEEKLKNLRDVSAFLTDGATIIAEDQSFDYDRHEHIFKETFNTLYNTTEGSSFRRYNREKQRFMGGFTLSSFEAIAPGVGYNIAANTLTPNLVDAIMYVMHNPVFQKYSGSGMPANFRLPHIIPLGRKAFKHEN